MPRPVDTSHMVDAGEVALDRSVPFTRGAALAAGLSIRDLTGSSHTRLLHGVYVASTTAITPRIRALAALRISQPGAWASHHTAGALWGCWMPTCSDLHVTAPDPDHRSVRRGVFTHRARLGSSPIRRHGVWVSRPVDVFLDLAALHIDLVDLVAAGDSLVKATAIEPSDLVSAAATWSGRGARFARLAAGHVRSEVDSPQESRLRMLLVLAGLPVPVVNRVTRLANGDWRWRFDLSYPQFKILIEYDGEQHLEEGRRRLDEARREAIEALGWIVIVVSKNELYRDPAGVIDQVRAALRERGCPGLRRSPATVWQRHFPIRVAAA